MECRPVDESKSYATLRATLRSYFGKDEATQGVQDRAAQKFSGLLPTRLCLTSQRVPLLSLTQTALMLQ